MRSDGALFILVDRLSAVAAAFASLGYAMMAAGVFVSVVFRYVFVSPMGWTDEVTRFLLVWCVMLGMAYTLQQGRHIRVTTLVRNFSPKVQRALEFIGDLIALAVLCIFVFKSYQFSAFTKDIGEVSQGSLALPLWCANLALPIGGGLFVLQYLVKIVRTLMGIRGNEDQGHH
ncbi:MAG: TRAP transporter small permease [Syntrophorhabdaceae bacterium]|jgi:C4-dicarboxylate transporter DctQ subunit|nr:TRAP transporter small permease [Syntrophorhabdaceae bacterium]MDD5243334.1 TRAP transporter small permease [Syntrophorhabdaceae bacterium]